MPDFKGPKLSGLEEGVKEVVAVIMRALAGLIAL